MDAVSYYDVGFTALVSVVPPLAEITPGSTINPDDAGKVPGLKGRNGLYHGYNWMNSRPSRDNVVQWKQEGSSVGFLASHYPAIDVDIMREDLAAKVVKAIEERMGPGLVRTGQHPKKLVIFRCDEPLRSFDMHYSRWSELLGAEDKQLIQFLGKGRQYVMDGIHPRTGNPYTIEDPGHALLLGPDSLPTLTPDQVVDLFNVINRVMASSGYKTNSNAAARLTGSEIDQSELKAPTLTDLLELVERMPNETPDRDEYIQVGYAIKAASQDDPELGFEAFASWCDRWTHGHNDVETIRRDWDKMVPPYRSGWEWLLHKANGWGAEVSDFQFGKAEPRPEEAPGAILPDGPSPEVQASVAARQAAAADDSALFSDDWLASKFVSQAGQDFLTSRGLPNACMRWNGKYWEQQSEGALYSAVTSFLRSHVPMARASLENPKEGAALALRLGSRSTTDNVAALAKRHASMQVRVEDMDRDPNLLNTPDGPIYLPTGQLIVPERGQLLTKCTPVAMDPSGECPRWEQFIRESTNGDHELAFYLQCLAGYALTGHTREQVFPFFVGAGGNGKSVFINILSKVLGKGYAKTAPVELFQSGRPGHDTPYQLANIQGARLVTTSETKAGGQWDEQRIKQVTGEDVIAARMPYGAPFEFEAQCTLIVVGNHNPDLEAVTDSMTRRMRVVPWDNKPATPDKQLGDKLLMELPGILAWCVQGAMAWYQHGLPECPAVSVTTMDYLDDQDTLGHWIRSSVIVTEHADDFVPSRDLYDHYVTWCRLHGVEIMGRRKFAQRVAAPFRVLEVEKFRTQEARGWRWMQLKPVQDAPSNVVNFPGVAELPPQR